MAGPPGGAVAPDLRDRAGARRPRRRTARRDRRCGFAPKSASSRARRPRPPGIAGRRSTVLTHVTEIADQQVHMTPLADQHRALGARMIDFAGWLMPVQYSGILEEHRAVRERAGLFDLSHMGELFVEGPEAGE